MNWEEIKGHGSGHYREGEVELIDLLRSGGALKHFAIGSVMKYVWRNRNKGVISLADMEKAKHFIDMLIYISSKERENERLSEIIDRMQGRRD